MSKALIVFASATTANKIKSELERKFSIKSSVVQTPSNIGLQSCSYSIKLSESDLYTAWNLIKNVNVYTKGVYRESDYSKIL